VEVGFEVASYLNANFTILVSRKLPFPDNPESGFGAVAEDGSTFIIESATSWVGKKWVAKIIEEQRREMERRIGVLRKGKPLPEIAGRSVILVDDGIAMGSTMRASIALCKKQGAGEVIVAAPVTGESTAAEIGKLVDEIVILEKPALFRAVAQVYRNWYDVSDEEVLEIMGKWEKQARG
jgi:predicted phosphoribosyltransferase